MLAVKLYWPRLPVRKFKTDINLILKKPGKNLKPDVYVMTKIHVIERLEEHYSYQDIAVIVSLSLCMGGNDYLPMFYGKSHSDWMEAILCNEEVYTDLFGILREPVTLAISDIKLNEDIYLSIIKQLYCPRGVDEKKLSIEENWVLDIQER